MRNEIEKLRRSGNWEVRFICDKAKRGDQEAIDECCALLADPFRYRHSEAGKTYVVQTWGGREYPCANWSSAVMCFARLRRKGIGAAVYNQSQADGEYLSDGPVFYDGLSDKQHEQLNRITQCAKID